MLKEDHRVMPTQRCAQQPDRIFCVRRHRHLPPRIVDELHFVGLAVPRVAALEEAARNTQHHRRRKTVKGAPAHRPAIVDLLGRGLGIFAELDFGDRQQPGERHSDRAADDPFLIERRIEHAVVAILVLQPERHRMDPALGPDILAEHQHPRVRLEFLIEHAANCSDHVDPLAVGRRRLGRPFEAQPGTAANAARRALEEHILRHVGGRR